MGDRLSVSQAGSFNMYKVVSDFSKKDWGGNNLRIEDNKPVERAKYNELKNIDENEFFGSITLQGYLEAQQKSMPQITKGNIFIAEQIDIMMNGPDERSRIVAAYNLGKLGDESAEIPLFMVINNKGENNGLRRAAAHALGGIGGKRVVAFLVDMLKNKNEDMDVFGSAGFALSKIFKRLPAQDPDRPMIQEALNEFVENLHVPPLPDSLYGN
jgi:hypothetical protein